MNIRRIGYEFVRPIPVPSFRQRLLISVATCCLGAAATPAFAQDAAEPENEANAFLERVVVTAQSTEQDLQDVPISVTAFTAEDIERLRISDLEDYTLATPNVQSTNFGNSSRSFLAIRGVTSFGGAVPYGIYVDGLNVVPGRLTRGLDQDLQDIERIEVLRGPQGTYFGRNTMAGAVNITSVAPDFDETSGNLTADASSFGTFMLRGLVNVPLSDKFAVRGIAFRESSKGFIDNVGIGPDNSSDSYGGRIRLRGELTDRLEMNLAISADRNQSDNFNVIPAGTFAPQLATSVNQINTTINNFGLPLQTFPILPAAGAFPENTDTVSNDLGVKAVNESLIASARFDYEADAFTVTSITGYVGTTYNEFGEEDFTNLNLITNEEKNELTSWSQEVRIETSLTDQLDVIVGGIYAHDESESFSDRRAVVGNPYNSLPAPFPALLNTGLINSSRQLDDEVKSTAAFAEAIFMPTDQWELRVGGRYTRDEVKASSRNLLTPAAAAISRSETFDAFTPRVALTYYPDDSTTLYGIVSAGYKVGGFNFSTNPAVPGSYDEESAINYEIGAKFDLGGRARLNLAAFWFDWEDVQVQGFDIAANTSFVQNAGKAHSAGLEAEFTAAVTDELQFTAAAGWLEAEFDEFRNAVNSRTGQVVANAAGTEIPAAPEWTLSGSLLYERPLAETVDGFAQLDVRYVSDHYFSPLNENPIDEYTIVNLSLGAEFEDLRVVAYADNLLDEKYFVGYKQGIHLSGDQIAVGEPRRIGLRVSRSF